VTLTSEQADDELRLMRLATRAIAEILRETVGLGED
jgi:hypothetical protein